MKKKRRDRVELLITLLSNSNADVNFETTRSMTALHFAVEVRKIWMLAFSVCHILICVRIFIVARFHSRVSYVQVRKEDLAALIVGAVCCPDLRQ